MACMYPMFHTRLIQEMILGSGHWALMLFSLLLLLALLGPGQAATPGTQERIRQLCMAATRDTMNNNTDSPAHNQQHQTAYKALAPRFKGLTPLLDDPSSNSPIKPIFVEGQWYQTFLEELWVQRQIKTN